MEPQLTMTQIVTIAQTKNLGDILELHAQVGADSHETIMETNRDDLYQDTGRGPKTKINFTLLKKYMAAAVEEIKATAVTAQIAADREEAQRLVLAAEEARLADAETRRLADIATAAAATEAAKVAQEQRIREWTIQSMQTEQVGQAPARGTVPAPNYVSLTDVYHTDVEQARADNPTLCTIVLRSVRGLTPLDGFLVSAEVVAAIKNPLERFLKGLGRTMALELVQSMRDCGPQLTAYVMAGARQAVGNESQIYQAKGIQIKMVRCFIQSDCEAASNMRKSRLETNEICKAIVAAKAQHLFAPFELQRMTSSGIDTGLDTNGRPK